MAAEDTAHTVAAIIGATLAAHGKTKPKNIEKAVRAYRACLDELAKQSPGELGYPPANPGPSSEGAILARG